MNSDYNFKKKIFQIIPLIPVYVIIFTVSTAFTFYYTLSDNFSFWKVITVPLFYLSFLMVLYTHTKTMTVSPGIVTENMNLEIESNKYNSDTVSPDELFCKKCNLSRPLRSHHCKVCNKCIMKMDHHCPWVANCVGFYNQKFFYLFLFYATLGDLIAAISLAPILFNIDEKINQMSPDAGFIQLYEPVIIVIAFMMALSMTLAIGFLFVMQTIMIGQNMTTIENKIYKDKKNSPFYVNDLWHNISIVLGTESKFEWVLPIFKPNKYNNGVSYEKPNNNFSNNSIVQFQSIEKDNSNTRNELN